MENQVSARVSELDRLISLIAFRYGENVENRKKEISRARKKNKKSARSQSDKIAIYLAGKEIAEADYIRKYNAEIVCRNSSYTEAKKIAKISSYTETKICEHRNSKF